MSIASNPPDALRSRSRPRPSRHSAAVRLACVRTIGVASAGIPSPSSRCKIASIAATLHDRRIYVALPWSRGLRGFWPARPARLRLLSGSCSSARSFAPRFLHADLAVRRSAVCFAHCDQLTRGLPPRSRCPCPCRARQIQRPPPGGLFVWH